MINDLTPLCSRRAPLATRWPAERLKLRMRQQLNKQIKNDKATEQKKAEQRAKVRDTLPSPPLHWIKISKLQPRLQSRCMCPGNDALLAVTQPCPSCPCSPRLTSRSSPHLHAMPQESQAVAVSLQRKNSIDATKAGKAADSSNASTGSRRSSRSRSRSSSRSRRRSRSRSSSRSRRRSRSPRRRSRCVVAFQQSHHPPLQSIHSLV